VPASRRQVFEKMRFPVIPEGPFINLPEKHRSRCGEGLTAEDMKKCVWVRPKLVAQIEFLEWIESDHLRHSKFVGLREDKDASAVRKEEKGNRENSRLQMVGALVSHPARYFNWNVLTFSRNNRF
jgi:ATP dependent DNA ligase-like protein